MATYVVKQGDCLSRIAFEHGFDDWRSIYDHPDNAAFREKRPNPDLIFTGDRLFIPPRSEGNQQSAATGQRHKYELRRPTVPLRFRVGRPWLDDLSSWEYELRGKGFEFRGVVGAQGVVEHDLPVHVEEAELVLRPFNGAADLWRWTLRVGDLEPLDTVRGIQQRLNNLWFYAGAEDGREGPRTRTAVRCFQRRYGLKVDGIAGPQTKSKLQQVYGS